MTQQKHFIIHKDAKTSEFRNYLHLKEGGINYLFPAGDILGLEKHPRRYLHADFARFCSKNVLDRPQ